MFCVAQFLPLKYIGYIPEGVWINHNLGSPDICLHGNPQPLSKESAALHSIAWFSASKGNNYNTLPKELMMEGGEFD